LKYTAAGGSIIHCLSFFYAQNLRKNRRSSLDFLSNLSISASFLLQEPIHPKSFPTFRLFASFAPFCGNNFDKT